MITPTYEVVLINGEVIKNLTYEESEKLYFSHAGSYIRPTPEKYKAP